MSADLDDLKRLKITRQTRIWLAGKSHGTGLPKQEIARDALHEIAVRELRAARMMVSMDEGEAHTGDEGDHRRANRGRAK